MKIRTAKKQAFLKTVSLILAMTITLNILTMPALSNVSAESADIPYNEGVENVSVIFSELPDSAELESMYIDRLFYGEGISLYRDYGRTALDGVKLEIYEALRTEIEKTAAGENNETVFDINISEPYDDSEILKKDISDIVKYLMTDLPQDFYWYDKKKGYFIEMSGYEDDKQSYFNGSKLSFAVSESYADKSAGMVNNRYLTVNPSKINLAKKAAENAQKIAEEYSGMSDYNKILGYKNRICNLTEYNHNAADNDDTPYGDPWQLVYVFDDDPDTNVVCEGYAKAFQYLCDLGGIECYTVMGNLSAGTGAGGHMWNIVVLNGKSYLADITNCDGDSIGSPDKLLLKGAAQSDSKVSVFNLGRTVIYTYDESALSLYTEDILTVSTEDYEYDPQAPDINDTDLDHSHEVCVGADTCPDDIHGKHQAETWVKWESTVELPQTAGYYYLAADVTLLNSWEPVNGTSLCLNGHTVSAKNAASGIIYVSNNKTTFNLCDCKGVGKISGNTVNNAYYGGGVTNKGTFNMYSGKISENTSSKNGGGVYNNSNSTFNIYGGEIGENTSGEYGGGVYNSSASSTFNMYGGDISGNTSGKNGGGMYNKGIFKMLGGEISGNTTNGTTGGGGVYAYNNDVIIGGDAIIKDNSLNDTPDDLYLPSSKTITIDSNSPLTGDAYIGVKTYNAPSEGRNIKFTSESNTDYSEFFHSNNHDFFVIYTDNTLWLSLSQHEHAVCVGADNCPGDIYGDHEIVGWQRWSKSSALPTDPGYYFLAEDVVLKRRWEPADGVSLCLNGHTISAENVASGIICIEENVTFNLCDCQDSGKISGNTASDANYGGGVTNKGTFNMYSGKISGNTSGNYGGGLYNQSTFNMYGGEISGNTSSGHGGGVYNTGTFNLHGGKIIENHSLSGFGGGVYSTRYTFNMSGGDIGSNIAFIGGAAYIAGGKFNMLDGKISGNRAVDHGGGICNCGGTFTMLGGEISGNNTAGTTGGGGVHAHDSKIILGGDAVIKDNYFNGSPDDLYIPSNATITIDPTNPLTGDAYIGLRTHDKPLEGLYVKITKDNDADYSEFFHSNNPDCTIRYIDNALWLRMPPHEHMACAGADSCPKDIHTEHELVEWKRWSDSTAMPTEPGYYFLAADVILTDGWEPADGVSLCLNGYTVSAENAESGIICIGENKTFDLCDCQGVGKISGNTVKDIYYGCGITNNGTFNMYSGEISGNTADENYSGGGVYNLGAFNMYGGKISGNTAAIYGGILNKGMFKMLGGEISGNTAGTIGGGGVYTENSNVIIGGYAVIKDNNLSGSPDNLYLPGNATVTIDRDNPLMGDAYICIATEVKPTIDSLINVSEKNNGDYSAFFHSDDPAYEIINSEKNEVQLALLHDHSFVHIEAAAPTCTEDGNKEYWVCDICWRIFSDKNGENRLYDIPELEAVGHKWGKWTITVEPTETSGGEAERICENDETHIDTVELKELSDTTMWTKTVDISPSCINEGRRVYTNDDYGTVTVTLKKLSHDYEEDWQKDSEKHWQICKNCQNVNPDSENQHSWDEGVITVEPTAENEGEKTFTCEICGYTRTEKIPKFEPPITLPSETEPSVTSPDETEPPITPPSETEPPITPPSETEPPVTPPSETEPPVTPPSETEPPVTPPVETDPPITPPSETDPPVTPPSDTKPVAVTSYGGRFVVPETSGTTAAEQTDSDTETAAVPIPENTTIPPQATEALAEAVQGSISKRVESPDYIAEMSDSVSELANNILTQREILLINSGSMIEILLTIDKISTVSNTDGAAIREALNGYKMWQYLDINLYRIIDGTRYKLNGTGAPVTIKINIPEALRKSGREYAMVRVHNGAGELISDLDSSADTITFATDRFSVYVLVYKDKEINEEKPLNTGIDSYISIFLATGITALSMSMTFTLMGTGIAGMSEETKNKVYDRLIRWGKGGGKTRKTIALALIFILLSYYYTVGVRAQEV